MLDLNLLPHFNWDEDEWVGLGPGSRACLEKMFGKGIRGFEEAAIRYIRDQQFVWFKCFGFTDDQIPLLCLERGPGLTMVDIEHSLCECEKYTRTALPHLKGRRSSSGPPYTPSRTPITNHIPDKWRSPHLTETWTQPPAVDGGELYEVSHIVRELPGQHTVRYHIRWLGWGLEHDSIVKEVDLKDSQEVLEVWGRAKQDIGIAVAQIVVSI